MKKKILVHLLSLMIISIMLASAFLFEGCKMSKMPLGGKIQFHEVTAVIPNGFVRDSTQSNDDQWVFEKGWYSEYIIIMRSDAKEDVIAQLDDYVVLMLERGADSSRGSYLNTDAVLSKYVRDGEYCQEITFCYNGSLYSFALRGGTDDEFQSLLNDINTPDTVK